jgi:hypothetical protein
MRPASSVFILFQVNLLRADGIMANNRLLAGIATTGSLNGTVITFKFTATGADARYVTVVTQA